MMYLNQQEKLYGIKNDTRREAKKSIIISLSSLTSFKVNFVNGCEQPRYGVPNQACHSPMLLH
jgi:hypothetical protein